MGAKVKKAVTAFDDVSAWEDRTLGSDEEFVEVAPAEAEFALDAAVGMQAISIRLPKKLIDQYKLASGVLGVGYQPLMRDGLERMIKTFLSEASAELEKVQAEADRRALAHRPSRPRPNELRNAA
jgi:hypothetical protein